MPRNQFSLMTPEERAEYGRQGGIKSGETKRRKKNMQETLDAILALSIKSGKEADIDAIKNFAALKGKNITVQDAILVSMVQKALKGDVRAAEYIRDTIGEKATSAVQQQSDEENTQVVIVNDTRRDPDQ